MDGRRTIGLHGLGGWKVHKNYRRLGITSKLTSIVINEYFKSDDDLNDYLIISVDTNNIPSINMAEKIGAKKLGIYYWIMNGTQFNRKNKL